MFFQDLSEEQMIRIVEMLKCDSNVLDPESAEEEKAVNELIDDWMNRNNSTITVLTCLKKAYE